MMEQDLRLINRLGLHARAASKLVQTASQFEAVIQVEHNGRCVNGKSIMGILLLAAPCGAALRVRVDGSDERDAMRALEALIDSRFGEEA